MSTQLERYGDPVTITPLKTGGRCDVHVAQTWDTTVEPAAFTNTNIVYQLRQFFDQIDKEAEARKDDPIAMVNALARMEALLADVRSVTATLRQHTAMALAETKVRRITIDDVATMEGTSETNRTDWQHQKLLTEMLTALAPKMIDAETGEVIDNDALAEMLLTWFRVAWRLTPIRAAGLDPDDFCELPTDEEGRPLRTPTVRIHDNIFRKDTIAKEATA